MHAGQLRYHDFTLLREAREQRKLRNQLSSVHSPISTNSLISASNLSLSTPSTTTTRFFGGFSTNSSDYGISSHSNNAGFGGSRSSLLGHTLLGGGSSSSNSHAIVPSITMRQQPYQNNSTNRTFLTSIRRDLHLKSLERIANASPSDVHAQHEFLTELSKSYPEATVARFEQYKEFAVDERIALLYL
eukprot:CAMPEP_0196132934 /NCGR_PEP_ID=MMETSP0910-20130528/2359_1 /TAXON_ID=49265 /ORGANISM="Thalassiosira rotula, Strain GSO102" /LENGTH=187 /DNA_ID=CAMNT_0041392593 /DNA_START=158 /DNA_END=717 /DNA_ORIENTATION=+